MTFGSVDDRRNDGGATSGGVFETRGGLVGSVIRRRDGARTGASAGVEEGEECNGEATVANVLVGLPLVGILKPDASGETGLPAGILS